MKNATLRELRNEGERSGRRRFALAWTFIAAAFAVLGAGSLSSVLLIRDDQLGAAAGALFGSQAAAVAMVAFAWTLAKGEMSDLHVELFDLRMHHIAALLEALLSEQQKANQLLREAAQPPRSPSV